MLASLMYLLDQDHPDWRRQGRGNRTLAVHAILTAALGASRRFALQFDRALLEESLGRDAVKKLMPRLDDVSRTPDHLYEIYEDALSSEQRGILRRALSPAITDPKTGLLPLTAIRSARGRDENGATVLRIGDSGGVIFFSLSPTEHARLLAEYELARIPPTVVEPIAIDVEALEP
jgi:hypothetical protein